MPPRAFGTSLRGGRSTRKGFKLALLEPSPKKSSPSLSGSPTQAGSSTQKPKTEGSSTQIVSIKLESSTQELPKNPTLKQTKADYALPIQTLLALQEIGLTKLPNKTWVDIASKSDDDSEIDLQTLIQRTKESKTILIVQKKLYPKRRHQPQKQLIAMYIKIKFQLFCRWSQSIGTKSL